MKLGLQINNYNLAGGPERFGTTLAEIAQAAEAGGFDRLGVQDHVWESAYIGSAEGPVLECYTTLGFLAAHTKRVKLLAMVSPISYRYPAMLAKSVTALDVLSSGRAWLGIGAGDYEAEARGLGIPFPPLKARFEMLEEALQVCLGMWSGEHGSDASFSGAHYQLERLLNSPQSLTRPHPPILIGGSGAKTLRLVARYADACNLRPSPDVPQKLELLRRECEAAGRDYEAIEKTCPFGLDVGTDGSKASELIGRLRWLAGMGIQTVIGAIPGGNPIPTLEIVGREVIPACADF
ncbi:MAG TPA: LLM class F420-dependent oxidoreductase [Ktedonobacterales bacterium]|nr:LLM class F420-dependent oxidoreductase [Ktedonobacterales bacterium]